MAELPDVQWCVLDILMRAKQKGIIKVNRHEMLYSEGLPAAIRAQLVFNALLMSNGELIRLVGADFEITEKGAQTYNLKFGKRGEMPEPTKIGDLVIALPDRSEVLQ
ncbi:hypothetical protein [Rhizobium rhizogenes]|uniref:hypothetical protein n=1 Tax=Rhizobium rhizogenes TaxID=359 RepID=UPI0022711ADB|nr:hypothetical protein [Rhizobium rhizogenes]